MGKDIGGQLEELALRVEALQGPDREVDARIWCHLQGWKWIKKIAHKSPDGRPAFFAFRCSNGDKSATLAPRYTGSLDAAMLLAPDGWWLAGLHFCPVDFRSTNDREWHAEFAGPITWAVVDRELGEEPQFECEGGNAATPALALTAAALRARARLAAQEE